MIFMIIKIEKKNIYQNILNTSILEHPPMTKQTGQKS